MKSMDLGRLGIPGVVGAGIALFCVSFYASSLLPSESAVEGLRLEERRLTQNLILTANISNQNAPLLSAPTLPPATQVTDLITRLHEAADNAGFPIDHVSYRSSTESGVQRVEITLPLKGSYPAVRRFLDTALDLSLPATLDDVELHRTSAVDPQIEVQARFSYYFTP